MLTPADLLMTDADHLIFRRVTGVMTQGRYHRADRTDAMIALGMEHSAGLQSEGRGYQNIRDWHAMRAGISLSNTDFLEAFYPELLAGR